MKLQGARELCTLKDEVAMEKVTTQIIWRKTQVQKDWKFDGNFRLTLFIGFEQNCIVRTVSF